jgi:hypothetical protein
MAIGACALAQLPELELFLLFSRVWQQAGESLLDNMAAPSRERDSCMDRYYVTAVQPTTAAPCIASPTGGEAFPPFRYMPGRLDRHDSYQMCATELYTVGL